MTHTSRRTVALPALLMVTVFTAPATAQLKINVDFTSLAGWPDHLDYGAAGTPGFWNLKSMILSYPESPELFAVDGSWTPVEISMPGGPIEFWEASTAIEESPFTGDDWRVMGDGMFNTDIPGLIELTGLENGTYRVLTYGMQPDPSPLWWTSFSVNGLESQRIGGVWTGEFEEGVTHASFLVQVTDGTIRISWVNGIWFGFFSALQIEQLECSADIDGDDTVGFNDLAQLLGTWGPCADACDADLDGDDAVGFNDLAFMLGTWGSC